MKAKHNPQTTERQHVTIKYRDYENLTEKSIIYEDLTGTKKTRMTIIPVF